MKIIWFIIILPSVNCLVIINPSHNNALNKNIASKSQAVVTWDEANSWLATAGQFQALTANQQNLINYSFVFNRQSKLKSKVNYEVLKIKSF